MSPEVDPFLEAILTQPDLRTPRLIFADYLEEQGDPRAACLRWQASVWERAEHLPWPTARRRDLDLTPLQQDEARLRFFACLSVRLTPWQSTSLLGLRTRRLRVWDWLTPSAHSAIAAAELYAAGLFTVNRLRRSMHDIRAVQGMTVVSSLQQVQDAAADAARYAATEASTTVTLAATTALTAVYWACQEKQASQTRQVMGRARAFQQALVRLVVETPME